jgi:hypothetical protein
MSGAGRFLDHLLVAALHRAVALAEVDRISKRVGEHLDFHVARVLEELLHVHHGIVEGRAGFAAGHVDRVDQRRLGMHHAHAASAAAARRLDDHRVADGTADLDDFLRIVGQGALRTGYTGHAGGLHGVLGADLVAHQADGFRTRADEGEAGFLDPLAEIGVFGKEAVAGMDGLGVGDLRRRDDRRDVEVALPGRRRADADRFVGELDILRLGVGFGMHGHRAHAEFAAGTQDAQGDFAPVCYENLAKHAQPITNIGCPYSTACPFSTWMALITPEMSASISFISFMASMMHKVSPVLTACPTSTNGAASGPLER